MDKRSMQNIKRYLQSEDAQKRIQVYIQHSRSEATVTIGRAARLFNFTENQLRDWENYGLLNPVRFAYNGRMGQRQYTTAELDKLSIIRELIDVGYTPSEIPPDIDNIWNAICAQSAVPALRMSDDEVKHLHIDQRIEHTDKEQFWRYFVPQVLRMSLMLICEDCLETFAGLMLPLQLGSTPRSVYHSIDLPEVGESLIGWLDHDSSFYTFLDLAPSFEYPSDFRVFPLQAREEEVSKDNILVLVQRKVKLLTLSLPTVETIRHLLMTLYENVQDWRPYFGLGLRYLLDPATDFNSSINYSDHILNGLTEMVIRLGGRTSDGKDRWRFCCILLPKDPLLPLQQRSLVVRAQSKHAPYKVGVTTVSPQEPVTSLSIKALQSACIVYRPEVSTEDAIHVLRELEGAIRSAIAIPIGGEDGQPLAVLYVTSNNTSAFSKDDQRVLRMMSRMMEELLRIYYLRVRVGGGLVDLIANPSIVDRSLGDFLSENEFVNDVEDLLTSIKTQMDQETEQSHEEVVSFIAVDLDNQSSLANKYGNGAMRNLCRAIGMRIREQIDRVFTKTANYQIYYIYAGRFYLLLKSISLDEASEKAEHLRQALEGSYQITARYISPNRPILADSMLELSGITTHLGVISYTHEKLREVLQQYPILSAIAEVRAEIIATLDEILEKGRNEGGNVVISWRSPIEKSLGYTLFSRNSPKDFFNLTSPENVHHPLKEQRPFSKERRIFVSHSHKDDEFGRKLVQDLRYIYGDDNAVWYDNFGGLYGGVAWWREIVKELTTRPVFIVVLSPDAIASHWVNDEIDLAWQQKNSSAGKLIIPVLYRECIVREDLKTRQMISFLPPNSYVEAFNELLKAVGLSVDEKNKQLSS